MPISQSSRVGLAGLLALVATYALGRQAFGLFLPRFREEFGLSLDVLGFYASAAQAGYLVATVVAGVLTARYGPRLPVVAGCLLLAVGAFGGSIANRHGVRRPVSGAIWPSWSAPLPRCWSH